MMTTPDRVTASDDGAPLLPDHLDRLHRAAATARDQLAHAGVPRWEVFAKASAIRELSARPGEKLEILQVDETGVAVRTVRDGRAGFAAASGFEPVGSRRAAEGALATEVAVPFDPLPPVRLLGITPVPDVGEPLPPGWAAHVAHEVSEAFTASSGGRLRLVRLVIQEGAFAWILTTAEGFVARFGGRGASLLAELTIGETGSGTWREWLHIPDPSTFDPAAAAAQIGDRALLTSAPTAAGSGVCDVLLHPEVTASLLSALVPLLLGAPEGADRLPALLDHDGRLAASALTLVDDRTDLGGPLVGPCDGEGLPARRTLLLDGGIPRHRLACYQDALACGETPRGGATRVSYRDAPASGVSNLEVETNGGLPPAALLERAGRALYLVRTVAPVTVDLRADRVRLLAAGVWLEHGRLRGSHPVIELEGTLSRMLRRIEAVGTDRRWFQTESGCIAAPSLLIRAQRVLG